jgi:hypothetical protein
MGIMLLLTLMICLQVTDTPTRSSQEMKNQTNEIQSAVSSLQSELSELEDRVNDNSTLLQSGALSNNLLLKEKQQATAAARAVSERELLTLLQQDIDSGESLDSARTSADSHREMSENKIAQLIAQAKRQQQALKDLQEGKRVVYNRYVGSAASCWIIEVTSDTDFKVAQIGIKQPPFAMSSVGQTLQWTRERHREGAEFLILLKPNARTAIDRLPGTLREEGIAHGYDLLGQEQTALDPVTGAEAL